MSTGTDIIFYFCLISYNCYNFCCCLILNLLPTCCLNHYVVFGPSIFYMCPCGHVQLQLDTWLVAKIHRASLPLSLPFIRKNTKWGISIKEVPLKYGPHCHQPSGFTHAYQTPKQHLAQVWISKSPMKITVGTPVPSSESSYMQQLLCMGPEMLVANNTNCRNTFD